MPSFFRLLWALSLSVGVFAGCASTEVYSPENAPEMLVIKDFAPFYSTGPMQGRGPDATLRVDSRVKLLRREFGYSLVLMENGRQGYMPNEALAVAPPRPPTPPASASGGTATISSTSSRRSSSSAGPFPEPRFEDIPLPDLEVIPLEVPPPILLDDEEPAKPPEFRL